MVSVTQVIGMGTIIHALLGWNMTASMLVGGSIVCFYTILGGMWSVTVTDIIQFVVMTVAIFGFMLPMMYQKQEVSKPLPEIYHHLILIFHPLDTVKSFSISSCIRLVWQYLKIFGSGYLGREQKNRRNGSIFAGVYSIAYAIAGSVIGMCGTCCAKRRKQSKHICDACSSNSASRIIRSRISGRLFGADVNCFRNAACVFYAD